MATPAVERESRPAALTSAEKVGAAALVVLWLIMFLAGGGEWDRSILVAAYSGDRPWMGAALFITRLGDWEVLLSLTLFACAWLLYRRRGRDALLLLVATIAARLLVGLQKMALGRIRPAENEHLVQVQTLSFPSGHSANTMVVYVLLAVILVSDAASRRAAVIAAVVLSMLVGASRVLLGVHWPSDVVGGWAFGLLWTIAIIHLMRRRLGLPDWKGAGRND